MLDKPRIWKEWKPTLFLLYRRVTLALLFVTLSTVLQNTCHLIEASRLWILLYFSKIKGRSFGESTNGVCVFVWLTLVEFNSTESHSISLIPILIVIISSPSLWQRAFHRTFKHCTSKKINTSTFIHGRMTLCSNYFISSTPEAWKVPNVMDLDLHIPVKYDLKELLFFTLWWLRSQIDHSHCSCQLFIHKLKLNFLQIITNNTFL